MHAEELVRRTIKQEKTLLKLKEQKRKLEEPSRQPAILRESRAFLEIFTDPLKIPLPKMLRPESRRKKQTEVAESINQVKGSLLISLTKIRESENTSLLYISKIVSRHSENWGETWKEIPTSYFKDHYGIDIGVLFPQPSDMKLEGNLVPTTTFGGGYAYTYTREIFEVSSTALNKYRSAQIIDLELSSLKSN